MHTDGKFLALQCILETLISFVTFWILLEPSGTFWKPSGAFWNLLEPSGTFWNLLEPSGTFWNLLEPKNYKLSTDGQTNRQKDMHMFVNILILRKICFIELRSQNMFNFKKIKMLILSW